MSVPLQAKCTSGREWAALFLELDKRGIILAVTPVVSFAFAMASWRPQSVGSRIHVVGTRRKNMVLMCMMCDGRIFARRPQLSLCSRGGRGRREGFPMGGTDRNRDGERCI